MKNDCQKSEKRNLFHLFKIYTCDKCSKYQNDEIICIGYKQICIFYLTNCHNSEIDDDYIFFNKKLRKILLSFSIVQNDAILLWIEQLYKLEDYQKVLEMFMDMNYDIFIISY